MEQILSIDQLQRLSADIRKLRIGYITNFFLDPVKHRIWIDKGDCYFERNGNTLFIIKKMPKFWNVFYCSTSIDKMNDDLTEFLSKYKDATMLFDVVGRKEQCLPVVEILRKNGLSVVTSLVRMVRITEPIHYVNDIRIKKATETDVLEVSRLLHNFFDEQTEQIPYDEELMDYAKQGHILVCMESGVLAGFLIYEINASTNYLRYWFTHPNFRDKKVGSHLLREFLNEGKETKRQLLWVIQSNENAVVRYYHYGFSEENMYDYVMRYT
ncbi:MAG: GNAT family N-acetyltransferase [Bacteroidales bacterium]|nr:GNAT family N-acetyltransferase [Bacteroidales bacterium]